MAYRASPENDPNTIHFVEIACARYGKWFCEIEMTTRGDHAPCPMTEKRVVEAIIDGNIPTIGDATIIRIIAVNLSAGTSQDVTGQIGALIFYHLDAVGEGFDGAGRAIADICARAGFDLAAEQDAYEASRAGEIAAKTAHERSFAPSRATHL